MLLFCKTRIAPTPSGYLHAGNALNFLLTAALAKRHGAGVLLRIDDNDRERYRKTYTEDIFDSLGFLNIRWQEGPQHISAFEQQWSQRHRMHLYDEALKKLCENNCVFACACSRSQSAACRCYQKQLPLDTPGASWRLITTTAAIDVKTLNGNTITASLPDEMKNFIVRRRDGAPAYQLCSVVDDLHFSIDLVVRGEDLWPSTLAQQYLATRLGFKFSAIRFYHHPLLLNAAGEKLSKSAGAFSIKHWREEGKTAGAFLKHIGELLQRSLPARHAEALLHILKD